MLPSLLLTSSGPSMAFAHVELLEEMNKANKKA
jgi:hypothetical protein